MTFELRPGTVNAIVGRTGAGKSTLVEAMCRLIAVPEGTIALDGRDITTCRSRRLRAQIGYAPQEAFLFSTTIADNIAMGYGAGTAIPAARARELEAVGALAAAVDLSTQARVVEAAKAAGLERDLAAMPEGLATIVGERGITLSGGQRQRVALARALAAQPRLLVLDDSLSTRRRRDRAADPRPPAQRAARPHRRADQPPRRGDQGCRSDPRDRSGHDRRRAARTPS